MPSCSFLTKTCCCSQKKGCFTIGYMNLAVSLILIFEFALPLASNGKDLAVVAYNDIDIDIGNEKVYVTGIAMEIVFTFILCLFNLVYDSVLLVGMHMTGSFEGAFGIFIDIPDNNRGLLHLSYSSCTNGAWRGDYGYRSIYHFQGVLTSGDQKVVLSNE